MGQARRLVVFVGGFDPRGARHYHQLMLREAAAQSQVAGVRYHVGPRSRWEPGRPEGLPHAVWTITAADVANTAQAAQAPGTDRWAQGLAEIAPAQAQAAGAAGAGAAASDVVFMDWSDVVRSHWPRSVWQVMLTGLGTYASALRLHRQMRPMHRETPYVLWTLAYPLVYVLLCLLLATAACWGCVVGLRDVPLTVLRDMWPDMWAERWPDMWSAVSVVGMGLPCGILAAALVLWAGYRLDKLLHVSWVLRILNFGFLFARQPIPVLEDRLERTARAIAAHMRWSAPGYEQAGQRDVEQAAGGDGVYREVVVAGFSVGSALAVSLVHALRRQLQQQPGSMQRVSLVTLGNCIPLFSVPPQPAGRVRDQLLTVAQDTNVHWADISSPSDSVSFGMCHLVALGLPHLQDSPQGREALARCVNPRHMCSPRFHTLFRPATYRWLRRNKMRMHFQYLMAAELPGAYDYFALLTCRGQIMDFVSERLVR